MSLIGTGKTISSSPQPTTSDKSVSPSILPTAIANKSVTIDVEEV